MVAKWNFLIEDTKFSFAGICGEATGFLHHIDLEIGSHVFKDIPIIFTKDINSYGFGILGHEGLFFKIKLIFELAKKEFEIIPKNHWNYLWLAVLTFENTYVTM